MVLDITVLGGVSGEELDCDGFASATVATTIATIATVATAVATIAAVTTVASTSSEAAKSAGTRRACELYEVTA
ncbi:hypothetical protein [Haloarcula brevis]|uniref:hypothetical protein n=1 Tax=Haloarcula brevis TaxID=3111453 RepID=UPI00300EB899